MSDTAAIVAGSTTAALELAVCGLAMASGAANGSTPESVALGDTLSSMSLFALGDAVAGLTSRSAVFRSSFASARMTFDGGTVVNARSGIGFLLL